jgi:hypothetical protein
MASCGHGAPDSTDDARRAMRSSGVVVGRAHGYSGGGGASSDAWLTR